MRGAGSFIDRFPGFFEIAAGSTIALTFRYVLFAGLAWLFAYVVFRRRWFHRKVVQRLPKSADIRREIGYSALSLLIFGLVGAATIAISRLGWTRMYWRIDEHGWGWFWASIGLTILLHDAWFYWTHRLMHHRRLFRPFHRVHHLSHNPTPWAAYAFNPAEAVVQAAIFPLAAVVMPLHPLAFVVFMLWQIAFNIAGHTGYEFHPRWLMDSWLGKVLNTPTNHAMHHEKMQGNFGLYFNVWDRLMGTNHADYEARFREVTSRPSGGRAGHADTAQQPSPADPARKSA